MMRQIKRWFVGLALTIAMLITLLACALTFSARSFQHNFAQISGNRTGVVSMAEIGRIASDMAALERASEPQRRQIAEAERKRAELGARIITLRTEAEAAAAQIDQGLQAIEARIDPAQSFAGAEPALLEQRLARVAAADIPAEDGAQAQRLRAQLDEATRLFEQADAAAREQAALGEQSAQLQALINTNLDAALNDEAQAFAGNFSQVRAEVESLVRTSPYGLALTLAEIHPVFLSTLLVCLSGALGSLLYLFPAYLSNEREISIEDIVVRMLFSMLTAFGFMVALNAANTVLALGGQETTGATASLNPFTVAGLGVIAGVMADDIAKWIRDRGVSFLGGGRAGGSLVRDFGARTPAASTPKPSPAVVARAQEVSASLGGMANPHGGPGDPA